MHPILCPKWQRYQEIVTSFCLCYYNVKKISLDLGKEKLYSKNYCRRVKRGKLL